jgi:hypothetical protein
VTLGAPAGSTRSSARVEEWLAKPLATEAATIRTRVHRRQPAAVEARGARQCVSATARTPPSRRVAASQRDLTCGMNMAWAQGLMDGLVDPKLEAELEPAPGRCCVVFHEARGTA